MKKCIIFSGAPEYNVEFLKKAVDEDAYIIAADSGYIACQKIGILPDLIIGDFDSSEEPELNTEIIKLNCEKAHTDTFSCVIEAVERGYNEIDILNALGNRFDHTYANVLILSYCKKHNVMCRILNEKNRLSLITDKGIINRDYEHFSLFAFLEDAVGVKIKGAYYTAGFYDKDSLDLKQDDLITQCNCVSDNYAEITLEKGTLLLVESND